ncbi:T9SS type A sorting domain-containing protein [Portibacter lacus]|uniref:Secretion system C-terminal sorting domain-containing protein n=1 Tax=Portibacter lacus TaxID=1099794 RepID=A0AA37SZA0_9BACT|nr:T9SS type A sorting domain-containing protein [Portibacter lacus]GLR20150.1 hypothetical protein GCM10007940_47660 [Portibacter lacus]
MKTFVNTLFLLLIVSLLQGQDYFWVGNEGNWSDLNHWATSSGGSTLHAELPGASDNVIFDENSFTTERQEVQLDLDSMYCRNLVIKDMTLSPKMLSSNYYNTVFIHGDIEMSGNHFWGVSQNYLLGDGEINIKVSQEQFSGTLHISPEDSLTQINLLGDFIVNSLQLYNGKLELHGFNLHTHEIRIGTPTVDGSPFINFGNSDIRASRFIVNSNGRLDAGSSQITIFERAGSGTNLFFGDGNHFNHVTFDGKIDRVLGNNYFEEFRVEPSTTLTLENGDVQTAKQFHFEGTSSGPISILSRAEGEAGTLHQEAGVVNGNYLIIKDNMAAGGATFNAFNSIDNGNVSGWNVEVTAPNNYYWIGGEGEWSDLDHWSKTSGGSPDHIELPSAIDNVIFDEKSVQEEAVVINIDLDAIFFNNFSTAGLKPGTTLQVKSGSEGELGIYGDVHHGKDVILNMRQVNFLGDSIQTIRSNDMTWGYVSNLDFGSTSTIELDGSMEAYEISISNGVFNSNGNTIKTYNSFKLGKTHDPTIDLSNSSIEVKTWFPSSPDLDLNIDQTEITCSFIFYGENYLYNKVDFIGSNWVYGPMDIENLTFAPRSEILIFPGDTVKFTNLTAEGTPTDSIKIASRELGERAYLFSESGTINGEFLNIRDNHAIGGATFIAENSTVDSSSVIGWNGLTSSVKSPRIQDVLIYPNPASGFFHINGSKGLNQNIQVYSASGFLMHNLNHDMGGKEGLRVDATDWPNGFYLIRSLDGSIQEKVMIMKK